MFPLQNVQIRVLDFILVQTGTYREQAIRPFHTVVTPEHVNLLEQSTQGGRYFDATAVQGVAGHIIQPQATVEGYANIREGWNSRRFRFLMRVEERHPLNPTQRTQRVLFGYTDHCDATMTHLDPKMRIYFNSETVVGDYTRPTPNGPVTETRVLGSNQIISPIELMGNRSNPLLAPTATFTLRPEDIFNQGQSQFITNRLRESNIVPNIDVVYDTRSMVGASGGYRYSKRANTTPTRYLADSLSAYNHAIAEAKISDLGAGGMDRDVLFGTAQNKVANQIIGHNPFFGMLKDMAGFMEQGYVTFDDLNRVFPETQVQYDITKYALDDGRSIRQINMAEHSDHWGGSDHTAIAAATLAQVVPAIMMDNYIRSISFAATNGPGIGNFAVEIHGTTLRSIVENLRMEPHLQEFERRLIFDALAPLTHNNQVGFQLSMVSDLAGDSVIDISLNGEPVRRYVAPTFTDSLFTPVITHQAGHQEKMTSDLLYMVENTIPFDHLGTASPQPQYAMTSAPQGAPYEQQHSSLL